MRWLMGVYIIDLSLFSRVSISLNWGWGRGFFSLQSLCIGIVREAYSLYKKKGAEFDSAPFELYVSFIYFILLS